MTISRGKATASRTASTAWRSFRPKAPSAAAPDVWIKKHRGLIVDKMYAYQALPRGQWLVMDDYRVGNSRGCGGLGIWDGQKLYISSN